MTKDAKKYNLRLEMSYFIYKKNKNYQNLNHIIINVHNIDFSIIKKKYNNS